MPKHDNPKSNLLLYALGIIPAVWLGLLIAPAVSGGLPEIIAQLPAAMNNPFHIMWCEDSLKTALLFIATYGMGIGIYLSTKRNYRKGEEHGSAKWGDARAVGKKYRAKDTIGNKLMTQNVRIGYDVKHHRRNMNTLVAGGSGSGKTRFYAKPNIMECNTSFVVLDPNGKIVLL